MWEVDLKKEITDTTWENACCNCFTITNATKLGYFQFKCLHHYITTNVTKSKYSDQSPLCTYCRLAPETTFHLLYYCDKVQAIWKALTVWLKHKMHVQYEFSLENVDNVLQCDGSA